MNFKDLIKKSRALGDISSLLKSISNAVISGSISSYIYFIQSHLTIALNSQKFIYYFFSLFLILYIRVYMYNNEQGISTHTYIVSGI